MWCQQQNRVAHWTSGDNSQIGECLITAAVRCVINCEYLFSRGCVLDLQILNIPGQRPAVYCSGNFQVNLEQSRVSELSRLILRAISNYASQTVEALYSYKTVAMLGLGDFVRRLTYRTRWFLRWRD